VTEVQKRVYGVLSSGRVELRMWFFLDTILKNHLKAQKHKEGEHEDLDDCSNFCRTRSNSRGE